ncbi:hypothetical protein GF324_06150, partial [bacterium]|nr:hypothetical protein [bacterium]
PIDGWRVQIGSVKYETSADKIIDSLAQVSEIEPHTMWRDGLYKVQVGDFKTMEHADQLRRQLNEKGFPDAFVVAAQVRPANLPDSTSISSATRAARAEEPASTPSAQQSEGWRIQIMSVSSMANAQRAKQDARRKLGMPVYIAEVNGMFKLRAGDFSTRSEADRAKQKAEQMGYKGAFPVRSRIQR